MKAILNAKDLKKLIEATKDFVGNDGGHPELSFIKLGFSKDSSEVTAVALDGYKMSIEHAVCESVDEDFTVFIRPKLIVRTSVKDKVFIEVKDETCLIQINDCLFGYKQSGIKFPDHTEILSEITKKPTTYKVAFNADYLMTALKAAKASSDERQSVVVLELRGKIEPATIRTNKDDIKIALPIRMFENN